MKNSESVMQTIVALCALDIPLDDPRFVKNGKTLATALECYMLENGAFLHVLQGKENLMATEQGIICLNAMRTAESKMLVRELLIPLVSNPLSVKQISRDCTRMTNAFLNLTNAR